MGLLSGKHALVTGGGSGIGAAIARALAHEGATVSLIGRRLEPLQKLSLELGPQAGAIASVDLTDELSINAGLVAILAFANVDILVNNAGQAASAPFEKTSLKIWSDMLAVNLTGTFLVTQKLLPAMVSRRSGRVINIASTAGLTGYAYVSAYVAAKHGVVGLTRALALEVAKKGVTVNAICPGFTDTPLIDGAVENISAKTGRSTDEARNELAKSNPQGRLVQPKDVAAMVVWLASPQAAAINGQSIAVDGGEVMTG